MRTAGEIQVMLQILGLYSGRIDGDIGPKSQTAIRRFQRMNGLYVDGVAGPKTCAELFPDPMPDRNGETITTPLSHGVWPHENHVESFYGVKGQNLVRIKPPWRMVLAYDKRVRVKTITLHEKVAPSAERVMARIASFYSPEDIVRHGFHLFGGSLNVRLMRGSKTRWSMHSWAIAMDFDTARNRFRWRADRAYLARPECVKFWELWEEEGWTSLGRAKGYDWMHVQAARR